MTDSRIYDVTGFDTVTVSTGIRTIVTTGQAHSVRVEAGDTATLDRVDVSVVGGRLSEVACPQELKGARDRGGWIRRPGGSCRRRSSNRVRRPM